VGSTALLALAVALVTMLALFEYFALGEAIGHRAYRFWTATCALLLIFVQWLMADEAAYKLAGDLIAYHRVWWFANAFSGLEEVFFIFVLGIAAITLFTKRPMVEALPAAGLAPAASCWLLFPCPMQFASRLWYKWAGALAVCDGYHLVGDTAAYFVGRSFGKYKLAPHLSPKKTWEGTWQVSLFSNCPFVFARFMTVPLPHLLGMAVVGNVTGQVGDLLESAYKRSAGIKDSGVFFAGHGACWTGLMRLSWRFRLSGIIGFWFMLFGHRPRASSHRVAK